MIKHNYLSFRVAHKVLAILHRDGSLNVTEITKRLSINGANIHPVLNELLRRELVSKLHSGRITMVSLTDKSVGEAMYKVMVSVGEVL